ncbi:hypothetical protein SAMN05421805_11658 [Saccharopolyspora antimicrobica]|uniref:Uncharacterized protein n=1 Tax=Saccharopolyspora antimicrobica TaxID=455193 RepID=A0A1I5HS35_9PSEU|nr:hypothetical protein ATL45_0619 [Saccharopolyspora antimicrobica]SFO50716.1 hypothetical protein SAMN05421805_11658 [Saccharopolyspora antimicrobica]
MGAGALLLALAACAQQPTDDVGFGGQPPAPPGPVQPKPENERTPVAESSLDATALPEGYPAKVWTQENGTALVATGQEGGCSKVHAELAEQTAEQVKLVLVEETPEPPGICTMDLRYPPVAVRLDAPLDARKVVLEQRDVKVPR